MDLATAARTINSTAYGYISSWALLTACEERLFDRLPARAEDLRDVYPDPNLVETWLHVLAGADLVSRDAQTGVWSQSEVMAQLLVGDDSYADYLGGQIIGQLKPRLTLGTTGRNVLAEVLRKPETRRGYEGWFADDAEARAYQASQFAGSLGPAKALAAGLRQLEGPVLDLGGGWGAMARAVVERHSVPVDVVDLEMVVRSAPEAGEQVSFRPGNALRPETWPQGRDYDGVILSYLLSSVPGDTHESLLSAIADRDVRWVAVHDFMLGGGSLAASWSLQHAVFVPGHTSRSIDEVKGLLADAGFAQTRSQPLVDQMTTMVVATR